VQRGTGSLDNFMTMNPYGRSLCQVILAEQVSGARLGKSHRTAGMWRWPGQAGHDDIATTFRRTTVDACGTAFHGSHREHKEFFDLCFQECHVFGNICP